MPNIREVTLQELTNSIAILRKQYNCKPYESIGKSIDELVDERNTILHSMGINEND